MTKPPQIAILGAGIFVRTQYIPRLTEISDLVVLKAIWSRTEESARGAVEIVASVSQKVKCKWGDTVLDEIIQNTSIVAVANVVQDRQVELVFNCGEESNVVHLKFCTRTRLLLSLRVFVMLRNLTSMSLPDQHNLSGSKLPIYHSLATNRPFCRRYCY
ncbi:hypothetical protein CsSME_00043118 [Camellia sinensis var. sinensis]